MGPPQLDNLVRIGHLKAELWRHKVESGAIVDGDLFPLARG
jgi:hypothetical protein